MEYFHSYGKPKQARYFATIQGSNMTQEQQQQRLRFQDKKIKDQSEIIAEQRKLIDEWIRQQQDPRHNQD